VIFRVAWRVFERGGSRVVSLAVALSLGCSPASPNPSPQTSDLAASAEQDPANAGLPPGVDALVSRAMHDLHLPGVSIVVVRGRGVRSAKSYGFANVADQTAMSPETLMGIASVTKMFTTVAVLKLAEEGRVHLDDPFTRYLGGYPAAWSAITVRQLLAMQSGIPDGTHGDVVAPGIGFAPWPDHVRWATTQPLDFAPGSEAAYSNTNFLLLGQLVESVARVSYEAYVQANILVPLGMRSTRPNTIPAMPGRATGYVWRGSAFEEADYKPPMASFSAGWLVSSAMDLEKLDASLRAGTVLTRASYDAMNTPQPLTTGIVSERGLGWDRLWSVRGRRFAVKGGELPGWRCVYIHGIDAPVSIIVQANRMVGAPLAKLATDILDEVLP
jgi:CubicO group peptidase (beta-lactamase class C family)